MAVSIDSTWTDLLDPALIERLDQTPFLTRCREGRASRAELHAFVRQQYFYSRHFTRYLCALLSNLSDESDRLELAHNLFEEMGFAGMGEVPHAQIYREMMCRMGVQVEGEGPAASTRALVEEMLGACRHPDPLSGLGALCLGAEAIVPHIYSQIVDGFRALGEPEENLVFFRLHIEEDDKHATTMRKIIERVVQAEPAQRVRLKEAAARVLEARGRFFDAISQQEELKYAAV